MITFRHVHSYFRVDKKKKVIFDRLHLSIPNQGITLIRGDSGVGKSTLLKLIDGTLKPNRGHVQLKNLHHEDIRSLPHEFHFFPTWTLEDYRTIFCIDELTFKQLNLDYLKTTSKLSSLSGGEKLRLLLLILIVQQPKLLLLDEPTHALDDHNVTRFINFIRTYPNKVIIATHDRRLDTLASQRINLKDAYSYEVLSMGNQVQSKGQPSKPFSLNKRKVKQNIIHYVFHQHPLGYLFHFFGLQLLLAIIILSLGNISLNHYQQDLEQDFFAYRVSYITKTVKESIPNSPFNLIQYMQPTNNEIRQLLTYFDSIIIDDDYSVILPKTITIKDRMYQVRLTEFDHPEDQLGVLVVDYDHHFDLSSFPFNLSIEDTERMDPLNVSFHKSLTFKRLRMIRTPLEEPTLYFSYQQIRKIAEETPINHSTFDTLAGYIQHQLSDYKLLVFNDSDQFFTIQRALETQEVFTLKSDGFQTLNNQSQWIFLLDVGSLFLLALSGGVFLMFELLVYTHTKERLMVLFSMLVPLGVSERWMKRIYHTHVFSSKVIISSVLILLSLGFYEVYVYQFLDLSFHLFISVLIVMMYLGFSTVNLHDQKWRLKP